MSRFDLAWLWAVSTAFGVYGVMGLLWLEHRINKLKAEIERLKGEPDR